VSPITEITMSTLLVIRNGIAVGAGDLLHFELHASALATMPAKFDVEALGLALLVLRAHRRHVERSCDANDALLENVLECIGVRDLPVMAARARPRRPAIKRFMMISFPIPQRLGNLDQLPPVAKPSKWLR